MDELELTFPSFLRSSAPPDTGIPPLDDLLVSARKGMEGLLCENALQRGDMVEIQGASGSGRSLPPSLSSPPLLSPFFNLYRLISSEDLLKPIVS